MPKPACASACGSSARRCAAASLGNLLQTDSPARDPGPSAVWVDALEVRRLARPRTPAEIEAMASLYAGDLLEDVSVRDPAFEDWLTMEREALRAAGMSCPRELGRTMRRGGRARAGRGVWPRDSAHRGSGTRGGASGTHARPCAGRRCAGCDPPVPGLPRGPGPWSRPAALAPRPRRSCRQIRARRPRRARSRAAAPGRALIAARGPPPMRSVAVEERPAAQRRSDRRCGRGRAWRRRCARRWHASVGCRSWIPGPHPAGRPGRPRRMPGGPDYQSQRVAVPDGETGCGSGPAKGGPFGPRFSGPSTTTAGWATRFSTLVDGLAGSLARRLDCEMELAEIDRARSQAARAAERYD